MCKMIFLSMENISFTWKTFSTHGKLLIHNKMHSFIIFILKLSHASLRFELDLTGWQICVEGLNVYKDFTSIAKVFYMYMYFSCHIICTDRTFVENNDQLSERK